MNDTSFSNASIQQETMPKAASLDYTPLAASYAKTMIIEWIASWALVGAVVLAINLFQSMELLFLRLPWIVGPYAVVVASVFFWAPLVAKSRGYSLRELDIHYKSGLVWHRVISLPFNRIQHVEMESGPLERWFKLTTLKFFTAGGGSADMKIPALTFGTASKLRSFVLEKAGVEEGDATEASS